MPCLSSFLGSLGRRDAAVATTAAASAAVAWGGRTASARLLSPEDLLLPPLRAVARRWQPRRGHPDSGKAASWTPRPPGPAAAPSAGQRQPRCRHPDHGPARRRRARATSLPWSPLSDRYRHRFSTPGRVRNLNRSSNPVLVPSSPLCSPMSVSRKTVIKTSLCWCG